MTLALALLLALVPQDLKKGVLDPAQAGPDYPLQGEYAAEGLGAQVVALGDGAFDVWFLAGGLPGAGWDGQGRVKASAKTTDAGTSFEGSGYSGTLDGALLSGTGPAGAVALKKVLRESPTLGAAPPEGAVVLLGPDACDFQARGKDVTPVDGLIVSKGTGGFFSKTKHGSGRLHVEFMLAFMPHARGQGRSNSGVYLASRHECQVLDSFGLRGEHNECGGIYTIAKPRVNLCLPPLRWQTYDVEFRLAKDGAPASMDVRHNGVPVHEGVELKKKTTSAPGDEAFDAPGPLHLQDHGNPVAYRNIWFLESK